MKYDFIPDETFFTDDSIRYSYQAAYTKLQYNYSAKRYFIAFFGVGSEDMNFENFFAVKAGYKDWRFDKNKHTINRTGDNSLLMIELEKE